MFHHASVNLGFYVFYAFFMQCNFFILYVHVVKLQLGARPGENLLTDTLEKAFRGFPY